MRVVGGTSRLDGPVELKLRPSHVDIFVLYLPQQRLNNQTPRHTSLASRPRRLEGNTHLPNDRSVEDVSPVWFSMKSAEAPKSDETSHKLHEDALHRVDFSQSTNTPLAFFFGLVAVRLVADLAHLGPVVLPCESKVGSLGSDPCPAVSFQLKGSRLEGSFGTTLNSHWVDPLCLTVHGGTLRSNECFMTVYSQANSWCVLSGHLRRCDATRSRMCFGSA